MNLSMGLKQSYWTPIEKQIMRIFYEIIFKDSVATLRDASAQVKGQLAMNSQQSDEEALRKALRSGRVQYTDGVFSGSFSSPISRYLRGIGAVYDEREQVFRLNPQLVLAWIKAEAGYYHVKAQTAYDKIRQNLIDAQAGLSESVEKHTVDPEETMGRLHEDFNDRFSSKLEVSPELSSLSKEKLAETYTNNMKLWIRKFSQQEIQTLRHKVEANAIQGYRIDKLIDMMQNRFSVTHNKAKFLARQETSLFLSKFKELRFKESGINNYRWSTSRDERVRHSHRLLHGTIQTFDHPPIVDPHKGRRCNPGEDWNCRCQAIPLVELIEAAA